MTDFSDYDDDYQGVQSTLSTPEGCMSPANDYEPLRRLPFTCSTEQKQNDGYLAHQPLSLLQRMLETLDNGLRSIAETQLKDLVPSEQLWNLQWSDITVCTQEDRSHQFYHRLRPISVEVGVQAHTHTHTHTLPHPTSHAISKGHLLVLLSETKY